MGTHLALQVHGEEERDVESRQKEKAQERPKLVAQHIGKYPGMVQCVGSTLPSSVAPTYSHHNMICIIIMTIVNV